MGKEIIIFTDGGARGNPGPAASGFTIDGRGYAKVLGETTNNVAEYMAVILALKKAKQLFGSAAKKEIELVINTDSELLYKQALGEYKIKEPELQKLFVEVWNLRQDFKSVRFHKVPREENKAADRMVNLALDGALPPESAVQ